MSHQHVTVTTQPTHKSPTSAPEEWTMVSMRQHLQTAVLLELCTIPLYLFAAYSIKEESGQKEKDAQEELYKIVVQEMLHLGLAGNILCSLRGRPQVYGEAFTPKYPTEILYEGVLVTLAPAKKYQLENFAEIEQPIPLKVNVQEGKDANARTLGQYESIGQFYGSLKAGLEELDKRLNKDLKEVDKDMFDRDSVNRQWEGKKGGPVQDLVPVADLKTALEKLELIIEQGEGGKDVPEPHSHYELFKGLAKLDLDVYPVASNPRTSQFEGREKCYPVMLAFDAAYSYLLWTLEAGWIYGGKVEAKKQGIKNNLHNLMVFIMRPLAKFLVQQKLETFNKNAAPAFNLYIFSPDSSPKVQLKDIVQAAADEYKQSSELQSALEYVKCLYDLGDI